MHAREYTRAGSGGGVAVVWVAGYSGPGRRKGAIRENREVAVVGENGPPKSGVFACNVEAVEATARQLGRVFDELSNFDRRDDAHAGDLASSPIRNALHDFYDD